MLAFEYILLLIMMVMALAPIARRLDLPAPIALVLGGVILAFIPWVPIVSFDPQVIFLIFVPPLLYWGSIRSSWRDLRLHRLPIGMLAIGAVLVTIIAVAAAARMVIPNLPWGPALVLGAIVSPPDAAVTLAIARRLGIPRRLVTILEGETLFNDVAAFSAYKIAIVATMTGTFSLWTAMPQAIFSGLGGIVVGLAVGMVISRLSRHVRDPAAASTISLITPFASYMPAQWIETSGVLAVVTTGLYLGRTVSDLGSAKMRVQGDQVWEVAIYILNGLIFLLIGIQLGAISVDLVRERDLAAVSRIAIISAVVIGVRIAWVIPAAIVPRLFRRLQRPGDPMLSWRVTSFIAWTGIRGSDTLVTALAIPLVLVDGTPFPGHRDIVVIAFGVILMTLVVQGLTLRPFIRLASFPDDLSEGEEEREARAQLAEAGIERLVSVIQREGLSPEVAQHIHLHHDLRRRARAGGINAPHQPNHPITPPGLLRINHEVLQAERAMILDLRNRGIIGDDVMRRLRREVDLEELVMERVLD